MDDRDDQSAPTDAQKLARRCWLALLAVAVVVVAFVVWKRRHRHHAQKGKPHVVAVTSASVAQPATPAPQTLALELWVKDPEAITAKVMPKVAAPNTPAALLPTFTQLLKNVMPPDLQKYIDPIDFHQPLGYLALDDEPSALPMPAASSGRFVLAAAVKDPAEAKKAVAEYAAHEGAAPEHSTALNADFYKGAKTGRFLGVVGAQVLLGTDMHAVEQAAPRLAAGFDLAKTQPHDLVARAPESWIAGPFAKSVESFWERWSAQQLGGTAGPAKALTDSISSAVKSTWSGALDLEIVGDVGAENATATATLRVTTGTPLSKFLAEFPVGSPTSLAEAPREALGVLALQLPHAWMELVEKIATTPPPEAESLIPADLRAKAVAAYGAVIRELEGEALLANAIDAMPNPGPGATLLRFKVKDSGRAKTAAHDFFAFVTTMGLPPGAPAPTPATITTDGGGSGEAFEQTIPPQDGQPPMPPIGFAWVVRDGYAYVCAGANPKVHVTSFASPSKDLHVGADPTMAARIGELPALGAAFVLEAPFRRDTPIAAALGQPPLDEAITLSVVPSSTGVSIVADFDLDLAVQVLGPMFLQPGPGGQIGGPVGVQPQPGGAGKPGPGTKPPGVPTYGGTKPPGAPTVVVPPAPTGYVLPIPTHKTGY